MTIRELMAFLAKQDPEMEVITTRCSDYCHVELNDLSIVHGVDRGPGAEYIMRAHPSMGRPDRQKTKPYLHIAGN